MPNRKSFKDTIIFILGVFLTSIVIISFLNPDLWVGHNRRLLSTHETVSPWYNTYILVSHFFHGGIQLWSRFDQMNNAYFVLSNGVYGIVNIITAAVFIILSPFFNHSGQALYYIQLFIFYGLTSLMITIGGFLLLRKFTQRKIVIFIGLLYLNIILTSYLMMPGFEPGIVYSCLPLLLYSILNFFEDLRLRSFVLAGLMFSLCLANSPLFALGYFYQVVHVFILNCIAAFILQRGWRKLRARQVLPPGELYKSIGLIICAFFIVLPYIWWGHSLTHDFYVHDSGIGGTQGRFNNIFNLPGYFSNVQGKSFANPLDFIGTCLDYHHNVWGSSWLFIGGSTLFLAFAGLILSKDKRKYIFAGTILYEILINTACFSGNFFALGQYIQIAWHNPAAFWARGIQVNEWFLYTWLFVSSIAHGINALTNPFSFLVRSFHMTSLLMSMMYLPLVALGVEAILNLWQRKSAEIHFNRRWFLIIFYGAILVWTYQGGTRVLNVYYVGQAAETLKWYLLSIGSIFLALVMLPEFSSTRIKWLGWMMLGLVLFVDFRAVQTYDILYLKDYVAPVRLSSSMTTQAVLPDYQNPEILPLREFFNLEIALPYPVVYPPCMYGAFNQFTTMGRFFRGWQIGEPRLMAYKDLYPDNEAQQYLIRNPRSIFFADYAFDSRYLRLSDILQYNVGQRVILVDAESFNKDLLKTTEHVYIPAMDFHPRFYQVSLDWKRAQVHQGAFGKEYSFDLPLDFPFYLSTTIFSYDYNSWQLTAARRILDPMQGELTRAYSYDVQNIKQKKLTILWPDGQVPAGDIKLQVKLPDRILNVWKNTNDDLGITFEAPKDGWIVFNYPYDSKWELIIDAKQVPISRVNRCFMGAPITQGKHQILMRYFPHTSVRFWIFLSMVLSIVCFLGIIFYSIKKELFCRDEK